MNLTKTIRVCTSSKTLILDANICIYEYHCNDYRMLPRKFDPETLSLYYHGYLKHDVEGPIELFQDSEHKYLHQNDLILNSCASIWCQSDARSTYLMSI